MLPELQDLPQWVGWAYRERQGRRTKVPLSPHGGLASSTDPTTWGSYHEALAVIPSEGVGFVFAESDSYCGLDLDGCVAENGRLHEAAYRIVRELAGYVEFSPSGYGLHIIVRGSVTRGRHTLKTEWANELAVYDRGRYFSMSGDGRGTIQDAQPALDALMARYFPEGSETPPRPPRKPLCPDDAATVDALLSEPRMAALWRGETASHGDDHSAADLALCAHLCFFTGNDPARVDALFRRSGLMRDKWDEKRGDITYGQMTIAKALKGDR